MKLSICHWEHNGKRYFERSGDNAARQQRLAEAVCTDFVIERNMKHAREWAIKAKMWQAISRFWIHTFKGTFRHAFSR